MPIRALFAFAGIAVLMAGVGGAFAQAGRPALDAQGSGHWQVGPIRVGVQPYAGRDVGPGAFIASAQDPRPPSMAATYRGTCEPTVRVDILVIDTPQHNLDAYLASRAGRDLPIGELLASMRQALVLRCPDLQVIRVSLESGIRARKYAYEGTMLRADGWNLQDGHVATSHDRSARVALRLTDFFGRARLQHVGRCDDQPTLLVQAVQERRLDQQGWLITNYTALAEAAAAQYAQQCRGVQGLRFAIAPMPAEYRCREGTECFLEAVRQGDRWQVSTDQLAPRTEVPPIQTVDDIAEVLAAGRFDLLGPYEAFFSFFVAEHYRAWSDHCREFIRDPVSRTRRWTTIKRDGMGNVLSEETSETRPVFMDRSLAWAYDRHGVDLHIFQVAMSARPPVNWQRVVFADGQRMNDLLRGQCTSPRNEVIRQNMLNRVGNQPPITGKYATSKVPYVLVDENATSAPAFIESYLREQAAAQQAPAPAPPVVAAPASAPASDPTPEARPASTDAQALAQRQQQELEQLDQTYRAKMQEASNALRRLAIEAEYRVKRLQLQREHQEQLKRSRR